MRINYLKALTCLSVVGCVTLYSCHGNGSSSAATSSSDTLTKPAVQKSAASQDQDSETYLLPSPLQIASIYKGSGLAYQEGLAAPFKDAGSFNSQYDRALNIGIYTADLSYFILNKQSDNAVKDLNIVKSLADKLGFGSVFESNSFLKRFQANMANTDSLASLIADLQMETDTYLENNKQKYIGAIAFAGAWVESMYIGDKVYEKDKSKSVSSRISEEMNILEGLVRVLGKYQDKDNNIPTLISQLKELKTTYEGFDEVKSFNPDSTEPVSLTADHVTQLGKLIEALHTKFLA